MKDSVYDYSNYKDFINDLIHSKGSKGRGIKRALAEALGCQSPFISQVLRGDLDFNTDQALGCAIYFDLSPDEIDYFLLLASKSKASTAPLKKYLQHSLDSKRDAHRLVKKRMQMKESIDAETQAVYYSSWIYSAIHMLLTIPEFRTREEISKKLNISAEATVQALDFLTKSLLIQKKGTSFIPTGQWYHLEKKSPLLNKHHTNLHLKSLQSLDSPQENDLHYSAFFSCARKDLARLEECFLKTLAEFNSVVRPSKEEELAAININLFRL